MASLESTLEAVTVYREGAVCVRRAHLSAGAVSQVRLGRLPMSLEPGSLRAAVLRGPAGLRVLDVRPQFDVDLAEEVDVPAEQQALEAARDAHAKLAGLQARLEREIEELEGLRPRFLEHKPGDPPREAPVAAMLALSDLADAELTARLAQRRATAHEFQTAHEEVLLRERRLREASTAKRTERARLSRVAVVTLSAAPTEAVELSLEYQVPGVRWVPNYQLKLERGLAGGTLQMRASVAQSTGEDWTGVTLCLSTASLARQADVPRLKALKLGRRQEAPPRSGWREPPPGLDELFAGFDGAMSGGPQDLGLAPPPGAASPSQQEMDSFGSVETSRKQDASREEALSSPKKRSAPPGGGGRARSTGSLNAPSAPPPPPMPLAAAPMSLTRRSVPSPSSRGGPMPKGAALGGAMSEADAPMEALADTGSLDEGGAMFEEAQSEAPGPAESRLDAGFLDYSRLVMMGAQAGSSRGRLQSGSAWDFAFVAGLSVQADVVMAVVMQAQRTAASVGLLPLPPSCTPVRAVDSFDYRYECAARVDVRSTGTWSTVPVMICPVGLTPEYVCVPSVEPKVYRTLTIANASPHALLAGPVDVSAGDEFLLTTALPPIPPGAHASHRVGLGVEEAIKVARKTTSKETAGGFLGGSTLLPHDVEIELNNRLAVSASIEVRERVPWADGSEKDLKVEEPLVTPPWEKVEGPVEGAVVRGARRWRVTVAAGQTMKLSAQFTIRMPSDRMIVGGNRRA